MNIAGALRGRRADMDAYATKDPRDAIQALGNFKPKEIDFTTYGGRTDLYGHKWSGRYQDRACRRHHSIQVRSGGRDGPCPRGGVVRNSGDLRIMDEYDAYYLDRHGERPLPVIYAELNDASHTRYYIDIKTARVAGTYSSRNWVNRWLYHGLHSLDFPWLYKYRPLWDIVVIFFMAGGTACVSRL